MLLLARGQRLILPRLKVTGLISVLMALGQPRPC